MKDETDEVLEKIRAPNADITVKRKKWKWPNRFRAGATLEARSGRQYKVMPDGSWRRVRVSSS